MSVASGMDRSPKNAWTTRFAAKGDMEGIVNVHIKSWRETYRGSIGEEFLNALDPDVRRRYWAERISLPPECDHRVHVAMLGKEVIGFVYTMPAAEEDAKPLDPADVGLLEYIHVDPDWWGRGVGRALVDDALTDLGQKGRTSVILWVLEENRRARHFYEANGWTTDGVARVDILGVPGEEGVEVNSVRYRKSLVEL